MVGKSLLPVAAAIVCCTVLFVSPVSAQCECVTGQCLSCAACNDTSSHVFPAASRVAACTDVPMHGTACPDDWSDGILGGRTTGDDTVEPDFIKCHLNMKRCPYTTVHAGCNPEKVRGILFPYGVDASLLSSQDIAQLTTITDPTGANIASYAVGKGQAALLALCGCDPHVLSDAEAKLLFDDHLALKKSQVEAAYNAQKEPASAVWSGISKCYRTALVAVFWDRALPSGAPDLWQRALQNDWHSVIKFVYLLDCPDANCNARKQAIGRVLEVCRRSCTADFMMVQDETWSLGPTEFSTAKSALYQVADGFGNPTLTGVRMGLEIYGLKDCHSGFGGCSSDTTWRSRHRTAFTMTQYNSKTQYLNAINAVTQQGGCCTFTSDAVLHGRDRLLAQARPLGENVPRVELTVTDGVSHLRYPEIQAGYTHVFDVEKDVAIALENVNISHFTIAVFDANTLAHQFERIRDEVTFLAGDPARAYLATSFAVLGDIAEQVAGQVCLAHAVATPGTIHINPGETRYLAYVLPDCGAESAHVVLSTNVLTGEIDLFGSHNASITNPNPGLFHVSVNGPAGKNVSVTLSGTSWAKAYLAIRSSSIIISDAQLSLATCCGPPCFPPTPTPPLTESPTVTQYKTPEVTSTLTKPVLFMWRREQFVGAGSERDGVATVTFTGQSFGPDDAFVLSETANCTDGTAAAITPVWHWNTSDPVEDLAIPFPINSSHTRVYVCHSSDNGTTWAGVRSPSLSQWHFQVWPVAPVWSTLTPSTPTANATLLMALHNVDPTLVNAVLTTDQFGCMHSPPMPIVAELIEKRALHLAKRAATILSFPKIGFAADAVYLCVSHDNVTWTLAIEDTPVGGTIGRPGFPVLAVEKRGRQARVACNDAFTGEKVTCTMCIDDGAMCVSPLSEECEISGLVDGNGISVCPLPLLSATNGTHAEFSFVPQFAGRAGSLALSCNGFIVPALPTPQQEALEAVNAGINNALGTTCAGLGLGDPGGASLFGVTSAGMRRNIPTATPVINDTIGDLTPVGAADTAALDIGPVIDFLPAFALKASVVAPLAAPATARATRAIPVNTASCRTALLTRVQAPPFEIRNASQVALGPEPDAERLLAEIRLTGNDGTAISEWSVWARPAGDGGVAKAVLMGAARRLTMAYGVWEKISGFTAIPRSVTSVTLEIKMFAGAAHTLGWRIAFAEPLVHCEGSVTPFTPPTEVAALEAVAAAVLPGARAEQAGWGIGKTDPCIAFWRGVHCRHSRVVALRLDSAPLEGVLPSLRDLPFLETLEVRRTNLTGDVGSQLEFNERIKAIDVSHNKVTSITVPIGRMQCLQRLLAFNNSVAAFPANSENLPRLTDLNLGRNNMSGSVPGLAHSPKLGVVLLSENRLSGGLPTVPPTVGVIDVHGNQFSGALPFQWDVLRAARVVDVSGNELDHISLATVRRMPAGPKIRFIAAHNKFTELLPNLGVLRADVSRNEWMCPLPDPVLLWPLQYSDLHDLKCVDNATEF